MKKNALMTVLSATAAATMIVGMLAGCGGKTSATKDADGAYAVEPAKNQSSGLFGVIQRSNCLAVLPEGGEGRTAGSLVECILLDVNEDVCL